MWFNSEPDAAADDPATIMMLNHECLSDSAGSSMQRWASSFASSSLSDVLFGLHLICQFASLTALLCRSFRIGFIRCCLGMHVRFVLFGRSGIDMSARRCRSQG